MERTPIRNRTLPDYTRSEEIFNMVTHIVGGGLAVIFATLCILRGALHADPYAIVGASIYGAAMLILYTMSSIYHGLSPEKLGKRVFQVIDHCSVFILIAGTYTPYCLCSLREVNTALGWVYFGIVWGLAILAVVLNAIDLKRFEVFSIICTLAMGWLIVTRIYTLWLAIGPVGFLLVLAGGIAYTIGAIIYINGHRHRFMHSVFHLFVILGTILQFFSIFFYVV